VPDLSKVAASGRHCLKGGIKAAANHAADAVALVEVSLSISRFGSEQVGARPQPGQFLPGLCADVGSKADAVTVTCRKGLLCLSMAPMGTSNEARVVLTRSTPPHVKKRQYDCLRPMHNNLGRPACGRAAPSGSGCLAYGAPSGGRLRQR
jgi:hypothetical protein